MLPTNFSFGSFGQAVSEEKIFKNRPIAWYNGINGVKSCILAISWQQNWPFRNYNLIQKIKNFQNIFLKINLFYMPQYTMTSEIYSWNQISGRFRALTYGVDVCSLYIL